MYSTRVLVLLAMLAEFAHCFSWDIVVGGHKQLNFYSNGTLTHTEEIPAANKIASITYDSLRYRLLFTNQSPLNMTISSYDLTTGKIQPVITRNSTEIDLQIIDYDPVTQLLFMKEGTSIYSFSLNPVSANKVDDVNLLVKALHYVRDIAVDSCGGYIYWITDYTIEKARFDGSQIEIITESSVQKVLFRLSLVIDQQTQKMYWLNHMPDDVYMISLESADFNGENIKRLYEIDYYASSLAISKDFIYWQDHTNVETWQLPKNAAEQVARKLYSIHPSRICWPCQHVAANYTIQEQIQGIKGCEAVQNLILNNLKPQSTVSICQNYCLEGDCSISAEGQPTCSCKAGYTGKRCEVNACHKHCLHNGVCSLNEEDEPVCECTAGYEGERCDVAITQAGDCAVNSTQQVLQDLRSGVRQILKEELKRILQLFSDKLDEDGNKC